MSTINCVVQQPLKDYIRLLASVKLALQQRFTKREEYLSALTDVEAKKIAYNKFASQTNKSEKASIKQVNISYFIFVSSLIRVFLILVTKLNFRILTLTSTHLPLTHEPSP